MRLLSDALLLCRLRLHQQTAEEELWNWSAFLTEWTLSWPTRTRSIVLAIRRQRMWRHLSTNHITNEPLLQRPCMHKRHPLRAWHELRGWSSWILGSSQYKSQNCLNSWHRQVRFNRRQICIQEWYKAIDVLISFLFLFCLFVFTQRQLSS